MVVQTLRQDERLLNQRLGCLDLSLVLIIRCAQSYQDIEELR